MTKSRQQRNQTGKNVEPLQFSLPHEVECRGVTFLRDEHPARPGTLWLSQCVPLVDSADGQSYLEFRVPVQIKKRHVLCADLQKDALLGWSSSRSRSRLGRCVAGLQAYLPLWPEAFVQGINCTTRRICELTSASLLLLSTTVSIIFCGNT